MQQDKNKLGFKSNLGAVLALAGSAVGLGNIWKFPYMLGTNGGSAFLFIYLFFVFGVGFPLMLTELALGRHTQRNTFGTFKVLAPGTKWFLYGILSIIGAMLILSFYGTISAWTLEYTWLSMTNSFVGKSSLEIDEMFNRFITHPYKPLLWHICFMALTAFIVLGGVQKGIEKVSKGMMPILLLIIVALCVNSITMPNLSEALRFLFYPDLSAITSQSVLAALGQAFFSLSIGMGSILTYASYMSPKDNLVNTSLKVITMDTSIAILAGVAIFPAVFSFNIDPQAGAGLAFLSLPNVFQQLPGGEIWALLFFILLTFAALTSAISILEIPVLYLVQERKLKRSTATWLSSSVIMLLGCFCTLSFGPLREVQIFGLNLFEAFDYLASNILLPLLGMLLCIFSGWYINRSIIYHELTNQGTLKIRFFKLYAFILRYIAPVGILAILLHAIGIL